MDIFQALFLGLLQGLTEFLPISSSAHLILTPAFFGWEDQGVGFDLSVHVGTLLAVVLYLITQAPFPNLVFGTYIGAVGGTAVLFLIENDMTNEIASPGMTG